MFGMGWILAVPLLGSGPMAPHRGACGNVRKRSSLHLRLTSALDGGRACVKDYWLSHSEARSTGEYKASQISFQRSWHRAKKFGNS